jgi:hypothetical protein
MFSNAQIRREIKDFNQSFSFKNSYDINLETNTHTDTISNFNYSAKFNIDKNGEGIFDFTNDISNSHTLARINYSQIKTSSKIKYLTFGGEHYEKGEIIMITMSINKESNIVEKLIIYNYKINKAYVFY